MGEDQAEELGGLAGGHEQPGGDADVRPVEHQDVGRPEAEHYACGEGQDRHLDVVHRDLGGELGRRIRGVVRLEVLLQVGLPHGVGGGGVEGGVGGPDPGGHDHGGHQEAEGADQDEPAGVPDGPGEGEGEEAGEAGQGPGPTAVDDPVRLRHQPGQASGQPGIGVGGPGVGEVG